MLAKRLTFFGAVLAYLALPGHSLSLLPGVPLGVLGIVVVLFVGAWAVALPGLPRGWQHGLLALLLLASAKLAIGWYGPEYGLLAEYRAGPPEAATERSTEWPDLEATRIDRAAVFHGDEFPVHFLNDARRFNFYTANEPRRDQLPFSARWSGQLWAATGGRIRLTLEANGRAELLLPSQRDRGADTAAIVSGQRVQTAELSLDVSPGLHPIEIRYERPSEGMPWLGAYVSVDDGPVQPLAAPLVVPYPLETSALQRDLWLRPVSVGIDVAALLLLSVLVVAHILTRVGRPSLERPALALIGLGLLGADLVAHLHLWQRAVILSGGNDWLAYESFARQIVLDGPLLTDGRPLGQGQPYYYQPLYSYWLALVHGALGEGLFGPLFMNAALGVIAGLLVYLLGRELFGRPAAAVGLAVFCVLRAVVFAPTAGLLLSENLLIPLVPFVLLLLARSSRTGGFGTVALAGLGLGLAGLTRTTPLALLPPAALILALAFRRRGLSLRGSTVRVATFVVVCMLTVGLATARNYVVSGRPVLITSSAGANLWEAHRPSERVDLSRIDRDPLYERLGLDRQTREVVEFVRQDPAGYVATLVPMALYAVGVVGAVAGTNEIQPWLFGSFAAYLLASALLPSSRRLPTWFLHAFVWSHLAQMTVFFSHQYGFRLILPMYVAMMPFVGHGLAALARIATRPIVSAIGPRLRVGWGRAPVGRPMAATPRPPHVLPLLFVVAAGSLTTIAGVSNAERLRESFYGVDGDAALAARQGLRPDYLRLADMIYFVGNDGRSMDVAYLPGLALPAMRWFDGARGVVLPPVGERGLYVLPQGAAADIARRCLGEAAIVAREQDHRTGEWLDVAIAGDPVAACASPRESLPAAFDGGARLVGYDAPASLEPGQTMEVAVHWIATDRPANRARPLVRIVDGQDRRWGQAEVLTYPSGSWRAGERIFGIARIDVDPTLAPGEYRVEMAMTAGSELSRLATDTVAGAPGQTRVVGGVVRLVSRSTPLPIDGLPIDRSINVRLGDVRLVGVSVDRDSPRPGDRVRLTVFWQNTAGRLPAKNVHVVLHDESGAVVERWHGIPVDGTYPTTSWKTAEVVRDTWDLVMPADLPPGRLALAVGLADPGTAPGTLTEIVTLNAQAINRQMSEPSIRTRQDERLGEVVRLVGYQLRNGRLKPGDSVELILIWQALAAMREGYVVSVQLLGADERPIAQHSAEPANGRRPTAGWLPPEYVEDAHRLRVPRETARGRYRIALMLHLPEEAAGLANADGQDRIVLSTEVVVE